MQSRSKTTFLLFLITLVALASGFYAFPKGIGAKLGQWHLGLDLVGGSYLVYQVDMKDIATTDRDSVMSGLRDVMERRVNVFGVSEPRVTTAKVGDSYQVIVELAGIKDVQQAIDQIGKTALLEFRTAETTGTGDKAQAVFKPTALTGRYLANSQIGTNSTTNEPIILIKFNSEGAKIFEDLTGKLVGKPLAIFLDGDLISMPTVREAISGGNAQISGQFTFDEARKLVGLLNAGALPAPISLISQQTIGATLGLDSLNKAMYAGLIGTILIILFMIAYYRKLGLVSSLALLFYIAFSLAAFKLLGITMTLAGIAGFVLSIGMAVDANILIFARTKEELARGVSSLGALEEGFRRAWPSIRDSNITTLMTSAILYYLTSSFVRGFALTLFIGVLISMFSAITVTRVILRMFTKDRPGIKPPVMVKAK